MTRVAILNSRQSKTPAGDDLWVQNTLAAVAMAASEGWTIVSSIGLNTWELVTWAAGRHSTALELIIPHSVSMSDTESNDMIRRFGLDASRVHFISTAASSDNRSRKSWWVSRDEAVLARAEMLLPVSIRRGGRLEQMIAQASHATADDRFRVTYSPAHHHLDSINPDRPINPVLADWDDRYLIHWTRGCHGPWPGETESDYYAAMVSSGSTYCRSGFTTLRRILREQRLRGSSWRIGANAQMVPLTALTPSESLALMRWRPRRTQWSFEPYGIAIERSAAERIGAVPVRYVEEAEWNRLTEEQKPFSHRIGRGEGIWPAECEWRIEGDVDLKVIPQSAIRILSRTQEECDQLRQEFSLLADPLFL